MALWGLFYTRAEVEKLKEEAQGTLAAARGFAREPVGVAESPESGSGLQKAARAIIAASTSSDLGDQIGAMGDRSLMGASAITATGRDFSLDGMLEAVETTQRERVKRDYEAKHGTFLERYNKRREEQEL